MPRLRRAFIKRWLTKRAIRAKRRKADSQRRSGRTRTSRNVLSVWRFNTMDKDSNIWFWLAAAIVLIFIYSRIRKPATTLPQSQTVTAVPSVSCASPSGDTFPSGVTTIAAGNREPVAATNVRVSPVIVHAILPVDAPPPLSLVPKTTTSVTLWRGVMPHYGHCSG